MRKKEIERLAASGRVPAKPIVHILGEGASRTLVVDTHGKGQFGTIRMLFCLNKAEALVYMPAQSGFCIYSGAKEDNYCNAGWHAAGSWAVRNAVFPKISKETARFFMELFSLKDKTPEFDSLLSNVIQRIRSRNQEKRWERAAKKERQHQLEIDAEMERFKPDPGFEKWVASRVRHAMAFAPFGGRRETTGICTACKKEAVFKKGTIHRSMTVKCLSCGTILTAEYEKAFPIIGEEHLVMVEPYKDGLLAARYYEAVFRVRMSGEDSYSITEYCRQPFRPEMEVSWVRPFWNMDNSPHWTDKGNNFYGGAQNRKRLSVLYPGNLSQVLPEHAATSGIFEAAATEHPLIPEDYITSTNGFNRFLRRNQLYSLEDSYCNNKNAEELIKKGASAAEVLGVSERVIAHIRKNRLDRNHLWWIRKDASLGEEENLELLRKLGPHDGEAQFCGYSVLREHMTPKEILGHLKHLDRPGVMLNRISSEPLYELLLKAGAYRFCDEWSSSWVIEPEKRFPFSLGINKEDWRRLVRINGGSLALKWLLDSHMTGYIRDEALIYFCDKNVRPEDIAFLRDRMSLTGIINYINKCIDAAVLRCVKTRYGYDPYKSAGQVIRQWKDYMDMAEKLGADTRLEYIFKPKDLKAAHDRYSALFRTEGRASEVDKSFPELSDILKGLDRYKYADDDFEIVLPACAKDIVVEGDVLGTCLGKTDRYFDRICRHESYIGFVRRRQTPESPFYTIEFEPNGTVRQKRTYGDRQDENIDAVNAFIKKWQAYLKHRLSEEDRLDQEKAEQLRKESMEQLKKDQAKIWHGPLAGRLLFEVLEEDLVEAV